jgi:hypothetical protein
MIGQGWIIAILSALVLWLLIWVAKDVLIFVGAWLLGHIAKFLFWMKGH